MRLLNNIIQTIYINPLCIGWLCLLFLILFVESHSYAQDIKVSPSTETISNLRTSTIISDGSLENHDSVKITITKLSGAVNSNFDEFAPVISADGLMMIFTSNRPITKEAIKNGKSGVENIYVSYYDEITWKWSEARMLENSVNRKGRNTSATGIANDGQRMLIYRGDPDGNIYESDLSGEEWSEAVKLPKPINSRKYETSGSISPDGRTIYFISNRRGGQGGLDIWRCQQDNLGVWGKAENLGPEINTPQNEEGIFIHPDGKTLFFSSRGHNNMGGYDIFKSVFENGKWGRPVNLGAPINTPDDDLCFVQTADGNKAYYTSSLPDDAGKKHIYEINYKYFKKKNNGPKLTLVKGKVSDDTGKPIGADIEITDNVKNSVIANVKSNSVTGKYLVSLPSGINYGLIVKRSGYLFYSENFDIPDSASFNQVKKDIPLEKITVGKKVILKNIFYDFGKASLRPESRAELRQVVELMDLNINLQIEISAFTDNIGTDEFNLILSQARAQSVVDYLFVAGIAKEQMVAKGYGETNPMATNETEAGRQLNRRTQIKILGFMK